MRARDIMVSPVVGVGQDATVQEAAKTLVQNRISAAPVLDGAMKMIGIVTEGDLLRRVEAGTERPYSWWVHMLAGDRPLAGDYVKSHAIKVVDIMSRKVVTASPDTAVCDLAGLMEENNIKRIPIVDDEGALVGIVSRSNIVQLVAGSNPRMEVTLLDEQIRRELAASLKTQPWSRSHQVNIIVTNGVVDLWGGVDSESARRAIRVTAERQPGVTEVRDHLLEMPIFGT